MRFIADLHIHSKYSRATSRNMSFENIHRWAHVKGITVVGTGDFTHPKWFQEMKDKLEEYNSNLYKLKDIFTCKNIPQSCSSEVYFMLTAEISCIYKKNERLRKIHSLVFVPDFTAAARLNAVLSKIGNISSDGRPILGLDVKELFKIVLDTSDASMLIPAHAWTPHFSVFGASSGFDSLDECFEELTPNIYAIETGLSSDPLMNWRLSSLDAITLISNSDAHSPAKLGREANIFDCELSYNALTEAIKTREGFTGTIEFFPEEGKYHYDGHRACGISLSPKDTIKHNYRCPVCGKKITVGVMHRVEMLADREHGFRPLHAPSFHSLIPLQEIISEALKVGVQSKAVERMYFHLIHRLGSEFTILMDLPLDEIERAGTPLIREALSRMRSGNVHIAPGYDGEYGKIRIFEEVERKEIKGQETLF
jgi:uncharacterized protein (TIGR00375 family)